MYQSNVGGLRENFSVVWMKLQRDEGFTEAAVSGDDVNIAQFIKSRPLGRAKAVRRVRSQFSWTISRETQFFMLGRGVFSFSPLKNMEVKKLIISRQAKMSDMPEFDNKVDYLEICGQSEKEVRRILERSALSVRALLLEEIDLDRPLEISLPHLTDLELNECNDMAVKSVIESCANTLEYLSLIAVNMAIDISKPLPNLVSADHDHNELNLSECSLRTEAGDLLTLFDGMIMDTDDDADMDHEDDSGN